MSIRCPLCPLDQVGVFAPMDIPRERPCTRSKRTDFTGMIEEDTIQAQRWVNGYPHGILSGRCARRVLLELVQRGRDQWR